MSMPLRRRALLAMPLPAAWMSQVIIHNVYVKFYTDVIGLDTQYVGWVYFAFNIWNVLNDPVFGVILDKLRYRPGKGKYLRVMRITVPFLLLGLVAMAWTPSDWSQTTIFLVFLGELFLFDVAATFYLISATSYVYLAAPTREDRIDVEVVRQWLANIFSTAATVVATQLLVGDAITERTTMSVILMGVVVLNGLLYVIAAWKLRDPPEMYARGDGGESAVDAAHLWADVRSILGMRAFWALFLHGLLFAGPLGIYFTAFLYYMDHVIRASGTQATISDVGSNLLVLLLLPLLAAGVKRVGSRSALLLAAVPYLAGFTGLLLVADQWWHVLICYVLIMAGRQIAGTAGVALDAALIDDNERATGTRKTGSIAAVRALLTAPVAGIHMVIFMSIITRGGYDQSLEVQTAQTQDAIRLAVAGVPIVFALAGLIPVLFLPYTRSIEAELSAWSKARRGMDDETAAALEEQLDADLDGEGEEGSTGGGVDPTGGGADQGREDVALEPDTTPSVPERPGAPRRPPSLPWNA